MIWVWLGVFVVLLILEFLTTDMVSIWLALAAIPAFILALLNVDLLFQIIVYVLVTILLLIFTRPLVVKYFKRHEIKTNVDTVINQEGFVTSKIKINEVGRVNIKGQSWSAISNEDINVNEKVIVKDIEGVKLIVEKLKGENL